MSGTAGRAVVELITAGRATAAIYGPTCCRTPTVMNIKHEPLLAQ